MLNKNSYNKAFEILKANRNIEKQFEGIGVSIEYGIGAVGKELETIGVNATDLIQTTLGFHVKSHKSRVVIGSFNNVVDVEVLYPEDEDAEFAMTLDDFCDFVNLAVDDTELQELVWTAITEKDEQAKKAANSLDLDFSVGITQYMFYEHIKDYE